jgi:hypothetical protein
MCVVGRKKEKKKKRKKKWKKNVTLVLSHVNPTFIPIGPYTFKHTHCCNSSLGLTNKKLSETEWRWPTHKKEMWAVIHYLKTWGHYIGSKDVVVWTDNVTLKYFATQPKLSSKQVRWQDTLALFNVDIRHKPRKENVVPDALSWKHQLKVVYVGETKLQKEVQLGSCHDEFAKEMK